MYVTSQLWSLCFEIETFTGALLCTFTLIPLLLVRSQVNLIKKNRYKRSMKHSSEFLFCIPLVASVMNRFRQETAKIVECTFKLKSWQRCSSWLCRTAICWLLSWFAKVVLMTYGLADDLATVLPDCRHFIFLVGSVSDFVDWSRNVFFSSYWWLSVQPKFPYNKNQISV